VLDFAGPIETASATVRSNTEKPDFFCITPPENSCFQWEFTCVTGARKRRRTPRWPVPGSYYLSPIRRVLASSCFRAFPIVLLRQETVRTQLGHRRDEVRRRRHMSSVQRTESRERSRFAEPGSRRRKPKFTRKCRVRRRTACGDPRALQKNVKAWCRGSGRRRRRGRSRGPRRLRDPRGAWRRRLPGRIFPRT